MFLLAIAFVALVAVYVIVSSMQANVDAIPNTEIQAPDNSTGKVVPRLYGKARLHGNNIYYGGLSAYAITVDTDKK